jgi:hypothetical protein
MNRRIGDSRIENGLGIVILTMAVSTVGFILAGSTDPRTHLVAPYFGNYFTPERPYRGPQSLCLVCQCSPKALCCGFSSRGQTPQ